MGLRPVGSPVARGTSMARRTELVFGAAAGAMIDFSLTREQVLIVLDALRIYSYAMEVTNVDETREAVDDIYDIINAELHPEYGAPIPHPKGCLT